MGRNLWLIKLISVSVLASQDGGVGLRRQFQVLVRKGMGSNPILDKSFELFRPSNQN